MRNACDNFRNLEKSTWDSVIKPTVERFYPQSDMKILKKYSRGSSYGTFAEWDNCFYFKPTFEDRSEVQFRWSYNGQDMTALYYNDIINLGGVAGGGDLSIWFARMLMKGGGSLSR